MSALRMLALSAVAGLTLAGPAAAQTTSRPNAGTTVVTAGTVRPTAVTPGRPTVIDGRPTVIDRRPDRPDRPDRPSRLDRPDGGDDATHLRRRLHQACFSDPNPPSPLCRRVYGDN